MRRVRCARLGQLQYVPKSCKKTPSFNIDPPFPFSTAAALVALVIVAAFKNSLMHDDPTVLRHVDFMWRLLIGLGCIPACIALYFRLTIPETPRFTMDIERNVQQAASDVENFLTSGTYVVDPDAVVQRAQAPKASRRDFAAYFSKWENLKVLIGTSWSWFALDVRFPICPGQYT